MPGKGWLSESFLQSPGPESQHILITKTAQLHFHGEASHQCCVIRQCHLLATGDSFHQHNWQFLTPTVSGSFPPPFLPFCKPELYCLHGKPLRDGEDQASCTPEEMGRIFQQCHPSSSRVCETCVITSGKWSREATKS